MNTAVLDINPNVRAIPVAAAHAHLQRVAETPALAALLEWHIFDGAQLCGAIRVHHIDYDDRRASLGYFLGQDCQGKSPATARIWQNSRPTVMPPS